MTDKYKSARSIRWHLFAFGVLILLPILLAGSALSALYIRSEREAVETQLVSSAKDISNALDSQITGSTAALKALATNPSLQSGDFAAFHPIAKEAGAIFPGGVVVLRREGGQQVINPLRPWGAQLPKSDDPVLLAADKAALAAMMPTVSNLYRGVSTGTLFVIVNLPLELNGERYLLNLALPPDAIRDVVVRSSGMRQDGLVAIIDGHHRIIARTRSHEKYVGSQANDDFISKIARNDGVFESTTLDGQQVLNGYYRSSVTGWTTVTASPLSTIEAPLRQAIFAAAMIAAIGVFCSIGLAMLYGRYIRMPMFKLRGGAEALIKRERIPPFKSGIAEIDSVALALADASEALNRDELAKRTLIDELNHRVKNTLFSVQSLAQQTLMRSKNMTDFSEAFCGRLIALSKTHDALSNGDWLDAEISDLVERIGIRVIASDRLSVSGPHTRLDPRAALSLGLVLHELATNAVKYGSLSVPTGRVALDWAVEELPEMRNRLRLSWTERGGPPPGQPDRHNFGLKFVQNSIVSELKGAAKFDFQAEGLVFSCHFPLSRVDNGRS